MPKFYVTIMVEDEWGISIEAESEEDARASALEDFNENGSYEFCLHNSAPEVFAVQKVEEE